MRKITVEEKITIKEAFRRGVGYSREFVPLNGRRWILSALYDGILDSIEYGEILIPYFVITNAAFDVGALIGLLIA